MKKILIATSLIMGTSPLSRAEVQEGQFAVLKTEKSCKIEVPEGQSSSQVYFSKDCKTAFIMPPLLMKTQIGEPVLLGGANDSYCKALDESSTKTAEYQKRIDALSKVADKAIADMKNATPAEKANIEFQIKNIRQQIAYYKKEIDNVFKPYDDMGAMRVKYTLTNDVMDSIRAFTSANPVDPNDTSGVRPVRFMPAQLAESVLVVSNRDPEKLKGRSAIRVNFPGYKANPTTGRSNDPNATYVYMNGAMSGIVDISTTAWCKNKTATTALKDIVAKSVALNLNYQVKVQTGVKLMIDARIETKDFLRRMQDYIVNTKFTRDQLTQNIVTGGLKNSIHILIDDKGVDFDMEKLIANNEDNPTLNPIAPLVSKVLSNYVTHAEDKLDALGIFAKPAVPHAPEKPAGSEDVKVGERTVCSSSSSWFGLSRSTSCRTEPVFVKVDMNGYSSIVDGLQDNSYLEEQVTFETNQTSTVDHSSTFIY